MTDEIITKSEYLEYRIRHTTRTTGTAYDPVLVKCPACDHEFQYNGSRSHHIAGHTPEDFGL